MSSRTSSGRVTKPAKSQKSSERSSLHRFAELNSCPAAMPCTYCFKHKVDCCFDDSGRSDRCKECIRRGRSCDVNKLVEQQEKLEAEEEEAGDRVLVLHTQLAELQSSLAEAVSRLQRIRKIKKKVKERGADLFERGMQELDQEDNILPALDSHEDWVVRDLHSLGVPNEVDWSGLGLGDGFGDVGLLVPADGSPSRAAERS
ncbi:hypothetical protein FALBO_9280 [Fusarium albosuccineum]|uniref:Zn(2)-C6 fungal-type domain-containing protein n=1 Tax=Fusarium albosuccineum TaxID=1237068 RepID=A0A8H4PAT5_9HYPO|nr:hypothetical protein FALBO_9280 [Fusarium albosuccineum]